MVFPNFSTVTSAVNFNSYLHDSFSLDSKYQVDVIYTDLSKEFDSIDHGTLIFFIDQLGVL